MLSFFQRDVLDEILDLTESASEDFPTYSCLVHYVTGNVFGNLIMIIIILSCRLFLYIRRGSLLHTSR